MLEAVYQRILGDALGSRLDFHSEFIDLARFSDPATDLSGLALADLEQTVAQLPPDSII